MARKTVIPKALREQVWLLHIGKKFETKCEIPWCSNKINAFNFQCGHNIPESRGGTTEIRNLLPICSRCNLSMSNTCSIDEWKKKSKVPSKWIFWIRRVFLLQWKSSDSKENGPEFTRNPTSRKVKPSK